MRLGSFSPQGQQKKCCITTNLRFRSYLGNKIIFEIQGSIILDIGM
jgi:hypothetical protein